MWKREGQIEGRPTFDSGSPLNESVKGCGGVSDSSRGLTGYLILTQEKGLTLTC